MCLIHPETDTQKENRERNFTHHPPVGDQAERYMKIREQANNLALFLNEHCPPSRELSLAMTNLEQSMFWANASIARNEKKDI